MSFGAGSPGLSGASTGLMPAGAMAPSGPNMLSGAQHEPENEQTSWLAKHPGYPQPMTPQGTPEAPYRNPGKGR